MECSSLKKYIGNIEGLVDQTIDHKKVINIWPNTITVETCIAAVCNRRRTVIIYKISGNWNGKYWF